MNPLNVFVSCGKFLWFTIHSKGIDFDPTKAKVIQAIEPPLPVTSGEYPI